MGSTVTRTRERLTRFFLARLQRRAFLAALEKAAEAGIVEARTRDNGIVVWMPGSAAAGLSADRIARRLARISGTVPADQPRGRLVKKLTGWKSIDDEDDDSTFDEPRSVRGRRASVDKEQVLAAHADPGDATDRCAVETDTAVGGEGTGDNTETALADTPRSETSDPVFPAEGVPPDPVSHAEEKPAGVVDAPALLALMRKAARPPNAAEVAALLLLADAAARSGSDLGRLQAVLRLPQPVFAVSGVAGIESVFVDLLRRGLVLPGITSTFDGYSLSSTREFYRVSADGGERAVILFKGRDHELDADLRDRQVSFAMRNVLPILAVADDAGKLPEALVDAADLALLCGPISPELIHATIRIVTGEQAARQWDARGGVAVAPVDADEEPQLEGCEVLTLTDLALAIRPGIGAGRSLRLLTDIIAHRKAQANGTDKREKLRTSSGTVEISTFRSNAAKGTGSTIIQPEPLGGAETDKDIVPRVETLSGYGEARGWALALKEDLDLWRRGELDWSDMSTRLLLAGPPGTGKTTFARALCNTLQVPLVATSVATWLEPGYLGDVLKRMTAAFKEAEDNGPAILFIDEVDSLGRRTATSRRFEDYWNSVVARALELLDGVVRQSGIIVVAATNHPDALDPALVRSGRLETRIDISMPDTDALVGIIRHHLKNDLAGVVDTALQQAQGDAGPAEGAMEMVGSGKGAAKVEHGQGTSAGVGRLSRLARHMIGYLAKGKRP
ncbi:ATP-binding protein [Mesorhizobium sp. VK25A]|uniref:ATP-binding protein n=1 Tax=Mesorhizobium vachelliae TaxID=3072309 RepID=A0ABU4ZXE5_9HYPH|nr:MULTISPECIES: ATP-binding protein [unclassified Mesorhizobium]MDX8530089.1 ATP-binding protein [Mesorhizobium sp. VK25D]MDX8544487.1 ATP-binding protein [Mesorhizobium sp. VK25A]